ncbi:MAG TPA: hypothetical protein IAA78_00565 [Candidatus Avamphibacillus intestinigallinarum]|nr:hypothetical protein [Candidatus Avamphibacillus intestinigallinarum]
MNLVRINEVPYDKLETFIMNNQHINSVRLQKAGYAVLKDDCMIGCFILESIDAGDSYWLQQLFIEKKEAAKLPVLIETILTLAREKEAKRVHVHSHQPVVDVLLEALQFNPQTLHHSLTVQHDIEGQWWTYQVS